MSVRYRLRLRETNRRQFAEWWSKVLTLEEMVTYLGYVADGNASRLVYIVRFRIKK